MSTVSFPILAISIIVFQIFYAIDLRYHEKQNDEDILYGIYDKKSDKCRVTILVRYLIFL